MKASHSLCILDTSVLIDLHISGVHRKIFDMPYEFALPDVILDEFDQSQGKVLLQLGLQSLELSGDEVAFVERLAGYHQGISVQDLFALVAAVDRNAILITGDHQLRGLAETRFGLKVHGTIWFLDEMIRFDILHPRLAAQALKKMINAGSRLPPDECAQRLRAWEGK
jgi:predicted nucleic acid-binding protein